MGQGNHFWPSSASPNPVNPKWIVTEPCFFRHVLQILCLLLHSCGTCPACFGISSPKAVVLFFHSRLGIFVVCLQLSVHWSSSPVLENEAPHPGWRWAGKDFPWPLLPLFLLWTLVFPCGVQVISDLVCSHLAPPTSFLWFNSTQSSRIVSSC